MHTGYLSGTWPRSHYGKWIRLMENDFLSSSWAECAGHHQISSKNICVCLERNETIFWINMPLCHHPFISFQWRQFLKCMIHLNTLASDFVCWPTMTGEMITYLVLFEMLTKPDVNEFSTWILIKKRRKDKKYTRKTTWRPSERATIKKCYLFCRNQLIFIAFSVFFRETDGIKFFTVMNSTEHSIRLFWLVRSFKCSVFEHACHIPDGP